MSVFTQCERALAGIAAVATIAASFAAVVPAAMADDQPTYPSDIAKADPQVLLKEFNNYWTPVANPNNDETTASHGSVTDAGVAVLGKSDDLTVAINNKADADNTNGVKVDDHYTQQQRAVIDGAQNNRETYWMPSVRLSANGSMKATKQMPMAMCRWPRPASCSTTWSATSR